MDFRLQIIATFYDWDRAGFTITALLESFTDPMPHFWDTFLPQKTWNLLWEQKRLTEWTFDRNVFNRISAYSDLILNPNPSPKSTKTFSG